MKLTTHVSTNAIPCCMRSRQLCQSVLPRVVKVFLAERAQIQHRPPRIVPSESFLLSETDADIADLDGGSVAEITFPNPNNLTSFKVKVRTMINVLAVQQIIFFEPW